MAGWVVDQSVVDQIASITAEDTEAARQIYVKALRVGSKHYHMAQGHMP